MYRYSRPSVQQENAQSYSRIASTRCIQRPSPDRKRPTFMSTSFNIRCIRLCPSTVAQYNNNTLLDETLSGNWLIWFLHDSGAPISVYRESGDDRETVGDVCDPVNVEHGEKPTVEGSLRAHDQLLKFLNRKIFDREFAERFTIVDQNRIRDLRNLVERARELQKAMSDIDAPVIFTVTWS